MAHEDYKEIRCEGDKRFMECGCVWTGHQCTYENACPESRRIADGIMNFLTNTEEGRARVAEVLKEAGLS